MRNVLRKERERHEQRELGLTQGIEKLNTDELRLNEI